MNLANKLTILRILLTPLFIITLLNPPSTYNFVPLLIFIFAIFTDLLDGFVARTKRQKTSLGTFLDPAADKLLLTSAFITLAYKHIIPLWVMIIVFSRDIIIVSGWLLIYIFTGQKNIVSSNLGKLTTFTQMLTIFAVLINFPYAWILWLTAVAFTIASGIDYTIRGLRPLNNEGKDIFKKE